MTITSIGSSFSYIRPEAVSRSAAPEASETSEPRETSSDGDEGASRPQASGSSKPSVADDLRALLVKAQEDSAAKTAPREAARAYGGR